MDNITLKFEDDGRRFHLILLIELLKSSLLYIFTSSTAIILIFITSPFWILDIVNRGSLYRQGRDWRGRWDHDDVEGEEIEVWACRTDKASSERRNRIRIRFYCLLCVLLGFWLWCFCLGHVKERQPKLYINIVLKISINIKYCWFFLILMLITVLHFLEVSAAAYAAVLLAR